MPTTTGFATGTTRTWWNNVWGNSTNSTSMQTMEELEQLGQDPGIVDETNGYTEVDTTYFANITGHNEFKNRFNDWLQDLWPGWSFEDKKDRTQPMHVLLDTKIWSGIGLALGMISSLGIGQGGIEEEAIGIIFELFLKIMRRNFDPWMTKEDFREMQYLEIQREVHALGRHIGVLERRLAKPFNRKEHELLDELNAIWETTADCGERLGILHLARFIMWQYEVKLNELLDIIPSPIRSK